MTDTVEPAETVNVVNGPKPIADLPTPAAGYYYATIKDRHILIKDINEAQSMVLGGYLRQITGAVNFELIMGIFGKLMLLLDNLVVNKEDMAWLEERILMDEIGVADFAAVFHSHTTEPKPVAAKKPRRGK